MKDGKEPNKAGMATDVWALVRGDNEKELENYLERYEHDIKKIEEVAGLLDKAINESKRRCGEIQKEILLEQNQLKIETLARELCVQRHIHALTITRNAKFFNRKFPSTNTGQSLRNEYFTQKRLREAEHRNLLLRECSEELEKELPRPELLGRLNSVQPITTEQKRSLKKEILGGSLETTMTDQYRSPNQDSSKTKSINPQDDSIDHPPQQLSMGYQEFRQDRRSGEMVSEVIHQEQLVDSLGYKEMAHVDLHIEGDSRGIKKEQIAHTHIASSQGNQKANERVPMSHETHLISKHQEDPHEHKHKTILGKAINRALENLHIKRPKKETRSGSSGSEGSRKNTQEIHIVSQAIADPKDPDNIENRLHKFGVPTLDPMRINKLERAHEINEIHSYQQPLSEKHNEESISATVHVHRESEHFHTQISQSIEEIHGVEPRSEPRSEPPIPPRARLGSITPPPIPPKNYQDDSMYEDVQYVQRNQISPNPSRKVPPIPISAENSYNPYTVQSEIDREVMEANQFRIESFSPEPVIDEAGYAVPERVLSPPPESNKDKKWTWKGTNLSSRSRTPTDYEVANLMAETAKLDLIHDYQTREEIPHMVEPDHVKSPIEMERVLSPVLSREHGELTKLRYDDGLEEQLRASILHATRSLTETEKKLETKESGIEYASINRSPAAVHQQFDTAFSTTSSISSTDIVHEVMSRRNLRLDGVTIRPIDTTITPPSTPLTNISSVSTHPIGDYLRSTDSHLSTHYEHEYHDVADEKESESKKSSPIYDEVAQDSSVHSSSQTPTTPTTLTPIAATRSPTSIHKSSPSPQAFAGKSPITKSTPSTQTFGPKSPIRYEFVDGHKEAQLLKSNLLNEIKEKAKNQEKVGQIDQLRAKDHEYDEVARDEKPKKNEKTAISHESIRHHSDLRKMREISAKGAHQEQERQQQQQQRHHQKQHHQQQQHHHQQQQHHHQQQQHHQQHHQQQQQHHQQQQYHHILNTGTYTSTVETSFGDENVYEEIDQYQINAVQRAPPQIPQSAIPQRTSAQVAREAFAHKQDSSEDRRYEGNRYHDETANVDEIGEDEALDWELIYTTNAIRQMSRNNKWRESLLNKDRIPKPPKKQQKEIPDVLPKNSPFVAKTVEPPRSKTPTSWTKNEGFTFSVPGIQRIDSEERDDPSSSDLKEKWGKILNEEAKGEVWKEERVERKHVPPHVTNIGATGSQIRVPSIPLPVQRSQPQPVNLQKTQSLPPSQRSPLTPDSHYYQGFVKDIRQIFSQPDSAKPERSQSVGNIYEVPRGNPRLNQPQRETQPIVFERLDRPVSTPNVTRIETVTTPTFVKQSTSTHVDTPARETSNATSPARLMSPRRLESPRPRPVDLSSLRADPEYRFYSLRTPSPSTPKRTPSPAFREYAQLQSPVEESTSKDEPIYDQVHEVQEVRQPSPIKQFYSPTWQRIEQEIARSNAQYFDETTQHYHEHPQHHEVHRSQEAHHHHHHQQVHHHPETRVEHQPHHTHPHQQPGFKHSHEQPGYKHPHEHPDFKHPHHPTDFKHLNGHSKMSDEERFVIIGQPKTPTSPKPKPVDLKEKEIERRPSPQPRRKTREILEIEEKEPEFLHTQREILRRREENQKKFEELLKGEEERKRIAKEREEMEEREKEEERMRIEMERRERIRTEEEEKRVKRESEEKERLKREDEERKRRDEERKRREMEEMERERERREREKKEKEEMERRKEEEHRKWEAEKRSREIEERKRRDEEKKRQKETERLRGYDAYRDAEKSRMEPIYDTVYESPGLARPNPFDEPVYEAVYEPKETSSKLEAEVKSPNKKLTPTPTEGGKWQVDRYEDEDVEKRTIPVYQGQMMHDGREMTVFPLASAHHFDQVNYQLGENQRPPGIPEHIDLTNAEEVVVETKTKVVTTVKRRALTGELFEENYSSESSGFPRSVHMDSPVQRLYGVQTLEHPHLESPLSRRSPRREMISDGASPIYDTVHSTPDHSHSQQIGGEDRVPVTASQEHETQRSKPEYRSIGTSPREKLSSDTEAQYFDRNGQLRRSWPVKTYEGNHLELGTHKYKLKKMPDLDSGIGSAERPSPERNGEETPALRDWDPRYMLHALYELSYQPRQETKRDRFVNMEGHVEVPSDETATVAELERNWKEQYMKTKDGRLQVFVTHYAGEAPVQDVSLHGIEIDANREDRTLLVHGGKEKIKVLLRWANETVFGKKKTFELG